MKKQHWVHTDAVKFTTVTIVAEWPYSAQWFREYFLGPFARFIFQTQAKEVNSL